MPTIHCFFSGGRDSALACYIAKRLADIKGWGFKLVHIDTTVGLEETEEYVMVYARWLGAELIVLRPDHTFEEYAARYPYWPHIYPSRFRWCYYKLKLRPVEKYLKRNYKNGDIIAMGIRGDESDFRKRKYTGVFMEKYYEGAKLVTKMWLPLLYVDDETIDKLIKQFGIPESPVWYAIGSSGECFCLAGSSKKTVARAVCAFPKLRMRLMRIDDIIHAHRRKGDSYPIFLKDKRERLKEWLQKITCDQTLLDYLDYGKYEGKSCQGSCIL
jgi:3'-phosphoadenosine 5'-phosphosulfate sulfotransferase (PAPS reductase)/FAD synthetase